MDGETLVTHRPLGDSRGQFFLLHNLILPPLLTHFHVGLSPEKPGPEAAVTRVSPLTKPLYYGESFLTICVVEVLFYSS